MILIFATPEEARELLGLSTRQPEIVRPQTSGPCVHYDDKHPDEPCTYPYGDDYSDGVCPHLDNPEILCPVKDACYAMSEVARMRGVCEAEQDERDADMAAVAPAQTYETAAPEWVEPEPDEAAPYEVPRSDYVLAPEPAPADPQPLDNNEVGPEPEAQDQDPNAIRVIQIPPRAKRKDAWSEDELWVVARATTLPDAIGAYRAAYPDSTRTDGAIKAHWRKLRGPDRETSPVTATPAPDFIGDVVSVTQCDEAAIRRPRFKAGDWVRISHPAFRGYTGTIRRYCAATANYLTHIDGTTDTMWLSEEYLEAA